jgi:type I site-specific restriction endonuclease
MSALRSLRPHQERAIVELRRSLTSGHKRPMLQMPTGAGKTLTSAHIVAGALDKSKRVAFCVPRKALTPREPSISTKNWMKSRAIAFAKRRAA